MALQQRLRTIINPPEPPLPRFEDEQPIFTKWMAEFESDNTRWTLPENHEILVTEIVANIDMYRSFQDRGFWSFGPKILLWFAYFGLSWYLAFSLVNIVRGDWLQIVVDIFCASVWVFTTLTTRSTIRSVKNRNKKYAHIEQEFLTRLAIVSPTHPYVQYVIQEPPDA